MPEPGRGPSAEDHTEPRRAPWERVPAPAARECRARAEIDELRPPEPPRHRALALARIAVAVVAVLVFLVTASGWAATLWLDGRFREVSALDPGGVTDTPAQLGDENFLIVGSDTRVGAQPGDDVGTTADVGGARADTVMIAHLPADRSRVVVVSFPRDLEIVRPPCPVWDPVTGIYTGEIDPGQRVAKINSAYQVGGPRCVTQVVQNLSGLAVNHFLGIDFQGFKAMVDAVGGVEVCIEQPLVDRQLGPILLNPGISTVSGDTALDYVRARSIIGDPTGDYGRIVRQQRFLSALLRELLSASTLFSPSRLRAVTNAVADNTLGENMDVSTLLQLTRTLQGLGPSEVSFVTVPTTGEANENGNEELRPLAAMALFRAIIDGSALPGSAPPTASPQTSTAPALTAPTGDSAAPLTPQDVRVRVLNGSGMPGQAVRAGRALGAVGFGVVEVANAPELVDVTVIRYPPEREAAAQTLAAAVPDAMLQVDESATGVLELLLGPDFDGMVTPVPATPGGLNTVNGADNACV